MAIFPAGGGASRASLPPVQGHPKHDHQRRLEITLLRSENSEVADRLKFVGDPIRAIGHRPGGLSRRYLQTRSLKSSMDIASAFRCTMR